MPRVVALSRYPVKSVVGQQCDWLDLDARGCAGDRLWSVRTEEDRIGSGKTTRRFAAVRGLLTVRAVERDGQVVLTLPDGGSFPVDASDAAARLSRHVGQPVTLARESDVSHFDDGPVSLLGTASVAAVGSDVDPRRFRANILIATDGAYEEEQWVGQQVALGTAVLRADLVSPRCVMVDAETAELPPQPGLLKAVGRANDTRLGIVLSVLTPGRITLGDEVYLLPAGG